MKKKHFRITFTFRCGVETSDFDAQMCEIKFWKYDENLRPVVPPSDNGFLSISVEFGTAPKKIERRKKR